MLLFAMRFLHKKPTSHLTTSSVEICLTIILISVEKLKKRTTHRDPFDSTPRTYELRTRHIYMYNMLFEHAKVKFVYNVTEYF